MGSYPEHEKLAKISDKSNACGQFVAWLAEKGIHLGRYHEHDEECERRCGMFTQERHPALYTIQEPLRALLAEFFEIDEDKIEAEKRAMLDELRRQNARSGT